MPAGSRIARAGAGAAGAAAAALLLVLLALAAGSASGFAPPSSPARGAATTSSLPGFFGGGGGKGDRDGPPPPGGKRINNARREQLGIADDEDEYDLGAALDANTDPFITKVIAGSFIVALAALLVVGVVVPSITDYGDGVCSPIQNGGRC